MASFQPRPQAAGRRVPAERLADRVGQTPFYAYDRKLITRVAELRRAARQHQAPLRDEGQPDAGRGRPHGGLVDGIDVASAAS
jgi:diaminopimelate decarboxylase